jgi:ABC-type transport system substrate-binding protein
VYSFPLSLVNKINRGPGWLGALAGFGRDDTPIDPPWGLFSNQKMEWIKDPKNGCWTVGWTKPLKSVEVMDEHTAKWNFNEPWGGFTGIMANAPGYMLSPKVLKEDPKKYDTHPSGTGPYILEDRQEDWTWIYDPDLMARALYHPMGGFNFGRSKNQSAIALIEKGRREVEGTKRQKIYWELEKVLYDNGEDIWLFWEMGPSTFSKNVLGYNYEMIVKHKVVWNLSHPLWFKQGRP